MLRIARIPRQQYAFQAEPPSGGPSLNDVAGLNEALDRLHRLLRRRVPDAVLSILARPAEREPGWIDWLANVQGQPVPLASLREAQRQAARTRLDERLQLIWQELDELAALEPSLAAEINALRPLLAPPADESVYVVNGEPVMTFWGPGRPEPVAPPQPAQAAAVLASEAATAVSGAGRLPARKGLRRLWWPWLLLALLLLAGFLFWWWYSHRLPPSLQSQQATKPSTPAAEPQPPQPDPVAALRAAIEAADCTELARLLQEEPVLQDKADPTGLRQLATQKMAGCTPPKEEPPAQSPEPQPPQPDPREALRAAIGAADCRELATLMKKEALLQDRADPSGLLQIANRKMADCQVESLQVRIKTAGRDCSRLAALRAHDPSLQSSDARIKAIRSRLDESLAECRKVQEEKARQQKEEQQRQQEERRRQQEEQQKRQAMADCPGVRPPEKAPQVVLVFDASGSMNWDVNMSHQQVLQVEGRMMLKQRVAETLGQMLGVRGLGSLMPLVANVPSGRQRITAAKEATRLLVQSLPADVATGLVLVNNCPAASAVGFYAPANRSTLLAQIDRIQAQGGTPLGDGIRRAASMVDGVNRDAVIVVLSDGEDSCGVNPCMVAQQIARSKPRLKINVVDIQSEGTAHCLAQATGGRFYAARSADQIIQVTREAGQDAQGAAHCRKQ